MGSSSYACPCPPLHQHSLYGTYCKCVTLWTAFECFLCVCVLYVYSHSHRPHNCNRHSNANEFPFPMALFSFHSIQAAVVFGLMNEMKKKQQNDKRRKKLKEKRNKIEIPCSSCEYFHQCNVSYIPLFRGYKQYCCTCNLLFLLCYFTLNYYFIKKKKRKRKKENFLYSSIFVVHRFHVFRNFSHIHRLANGENVNSYIWGKNIENGCTFYVEIKFKSNGNECVRLIS